MTIAQKSAPLLLVHFYFSKAMIDRVKNGGPALIPFEEIINTTRASFGVIKSLREGCWVEV
jgi:hypothetical protein